MFFIWLSFNIVHLLNHLIYVGENILEYYSRISRIFSYMFLYYLYNLEFNNIDNYALIRITFISLIFGNTVFYGVIYRTFKDGTILDHILMNLMHGCLLILAFFYQNNSYDYNYDESLYKNEMTYYLYNVSLYYILYNLILQFKFDIYCYDFIDFKKQAIKSIFIFLIFFSFVFILM